MSIDDRKSPDYAKMSHATAMSLGLMAGRMYRGAVNRCVNLLVHYPEGCTANCAYCGLARNRPGAYKEKSFIHVEWPIHSMNEIIAAVNRAPHYVKRTCISMITTGRCRPDILEMTRRMKQETRLPVSLLISPTLLNKQDLHAMKEAGADKIGVALDLATPELFDRYRGSGVSGPHTWDRYWRLLSQGVAVFQRGNVGAHLMIGMGETEQQMVTLMDTLWKMGVDNHLFSFFAEKGSALGDRPQPPWPSYLRIQLARYLIEEGLSDVKKIRYDAEGRIREFGIERGMLDRVVGSGLPFMTSGCLGPDGQVACNRPFGNCLPEVRQWNYPYPPNEEEIALVRASVLDQAGSCG